MPVTVLDPVIHAEQETQGAYSKEDIDNTDW